MNILVNSQVLAQELRLLDKVVNPKMTIPVLQNILFVAGADTTTLQLHATDLEIGLSTRCDARVLEPGRITLPSKKLLDLVNQLPDAEVSIRLDKHAVRISSGTFNSRLQALSADDFPLMPSDVGETHAVPLSTLHALVDRVRFATSDKNVRFFMSGAQLSLTDTVVALVATNGRRLALVTAPRVGKATDAVIVPNKALDLLLSIEGDSDVVYSAGSRHLFFASGPRLFFSRMIDGTFPNYQVIIPRDNVVTVSIDRIALAAALRRVSLTSDMNFAVFFAFDANALRLTSSSAEVGDADEQIVVAYQGAPLKICLNWQYVLDFLNVAQGREILFSMKNAETALLLTDGSDYLNVVMPMR